MASRSFAFARFRLSDSCHIITLSSFRYYARSHGAGVSDTPDMYCPVRVCAYQTAATSNTHTLIPSHHSHRFSLSIDIFLSPYIRLWRRSDTLSSFRPLLSDFFLCQRRNAAAAGDGACLPQVSAPLPRRFAALEFPGGACRGRVAAGRDTRDSSALNHSAAFRGAALLIL